MYKYVDETRIQPCPQNGFYDGKAISNLPVFFAHNSGAAANEGYMPLTVTAAPEPLAGYTYVKRYAVTDGVIVQSWLAVEAEEILGEEM